MAGKYRKNYRVAKKFYIDSRILIAIEAIAKKKNIPESHLIEDILKENKEIKEKIEKFYE